MTDVCGGRPVLGQAWLARACESSAFPLENLAFGGPNMKTLFFTAHTSVYSMRVKVAGLPGHPFKKG
jgi:sugar lactone lactonase YvrE